MDHVYAIIKWAPNTETHPHPRLLNSAARPPSASASQAVTVMLKHVVPAPLKIAQCRLMALYKAVGVGVGLRGESAIQK